MTDEGRRLGALPKVELHLHLDCCLSYAAARELEPSLTRAEYEEQFVAPEKCADLMDLLRRVDRPLELLQEEDALALATDDLFDQLVCDHVVYAEIRFAPLLHTRRGLSAERVVETVTAAAAKASRRTRVRYGILVCTLRHFSERESLETARLAVEGATSGVVGFDIAGHEAGFSLDAHEGAFDLARDGGLSLTAHAGEAHGAGSVRETLERLRPSRVGHGVRSVEDVGTIELLKREGVHLEVCPTSNVQSDVCYTLSDHPVARLLDAGVSLSISTDGRALCGVSLTEEYLRLGRTFGWGANTLRRINREAIRAAFAPREVKSDVEARLGAMPGKRNGPEEVLGGSRTPL